MGKPLSTNPLLRPDPPLCVLIWHVHMKRPDCLPACNYFRGAWHAPSPRCSLIGGLLYTVQMFSCAISWLFFKWPLSQGMAGQPRETSALTIFLSKQQMALLLSFWSLSKNSQGWGVGLHWAAWQRTARGSVSPPTVALLTDVFSLMLVFAFVSSCDSISAGCHELWFVRPPVTVARSPHWYGYLVSRPPCICCKSGHVGQCHSLPGSPQDLHTRFPGAMHQTRLIRKRSFLGASLSKQDLL